MVNAKKFSPERAKEKDESHHALGDKRAGTLGLSKGLSPLQGFDGDDEFPPRAHALG
jgi:hypothetical protein